MRISCRRMLVIAGFCLASFSCIRSQSVYYVDPRGDDSRDGRTPATAWRTVAKVNNSSFSSGDQILFIRGGVWREALQVGSSGSAGKPIVYGAYGTGPRPAFDLGGSLSGWSTASNWTDRGGNVWSISASFPGRMWFKRPEFDSLKEFGRPGFENASGSTYVQEQGTNVVDSHYRWWWTGGTLYVYAAANPATYYTDIQVAAVQRSSSWSGASYVSFQSLEWRRGSQCVELNNCDYLTFDSCALGAGTARYILRATHSSDHNTIQNHCTIDRQDTIRHQIENGGGAAEGNATDAVALNCSSYWEIKDSFFGTCGHSGVNIDDGDNVGYSQYNKIHDCEFTGGGDYDRAFLMNAVYSLKGCSYNEFYRNYVHNMETVSQLGGLHNKVYYNVFANQSFIWWDALLANPLLKGGRSAAISTQNDHYCQHVSILNNTFYNLAKAAIFISGNNSTTFGQHMIANNVIYNAGTSNDWNSKYCGLCVGADATNDTVRNNIIYSPSSTATCIIGQDLNWGGPLDTRTVEYVQTHANGNTISSNLGVNPQLRSDFHIPATSPAKDAGVSVGLTGVDFFGTPIPRSNPDIGAAEVPASGAASADQPGSDTAPAVFSLLQNYPNPFNPATAIAYTLPRASRVVLEVFNALGQRVAGLVDDIVPAGTHQVRFDGGNLASGTYFYRLLAEGEAPLVRKMIFLK